MGLNVALNVALSGLFANQTAIAATSENIANVNTRDFARREARFTADAIPDQFAGVSVDVVRAGVDRFLQAEGFASRAGAAAGALEADVFGAIEASLGGVGDNISFANLLGDAFAALIEVSAAPQSLAARGDALARLDDAFAAFARTLDQIGRQSDATASGLAVDIDRVNALLEDIHRLNAVAPQSDGAKDLIDARLSELSEYLSFTVVRDDVGRVSVTSASGLALADAGGHARLGQAGGSGVQLTVDRIDGASRATTSLSADAASALSGGRIAAAIGLLTDGLPRLTAIVSDAADGVAASLNGAYTGNAIVGSSAPTADALLIGGAGRYAVNADLLADPSRFAVARAGAGAAGALDGSGAAALAAVANDPSVDAASDSVALIGSAARNADLARASREAIANEVSGRLAASAGVNLDEELSNLIVFQRAYGANARVIAAVDELWQSLLAIL